MQWQLLFLSIPPVVVYVVLFATGKSRIGIFAAIGTAALELLYNSFALGFIEIYLAAYLPDHVQPYREALALGAVIAILLVRPNGLIPAVTIGKEKV